MSEEIYDKEIAPLLLQASKIAEAHGLPFVACVEYQPENFGRTEYLGPNPSAAMRMASWAARAAGNLDKFFIAAIRDGKKNGHTSAFLTSIKLSSQNN